MSEPSPHARGSVKARKAPKPSEELPEGLPEAATGAPTRFTLRQLHPATLLPLLRAFLAENGTLYAMYAVVFVNLVGFGMVVPLIPFFADSLRADAWQVTLMFTAYSVGQVFAEPFFGRLSDRIGRKPVIFWTTASNVLFYVLLAFAPNIWIAILVRFLNGIGSANISTIQGYVTDKSTPQQQAGRLGMIGAAFSLGFIAGPALSLFASHEAGMKGFQPPIFMAAALSGIAALGILWFVKESRKPTTTAVKPVNLRQSFAEVRRHPILSRIIAASLLYMFAMATLESTFGLWVKARYHWGTNEIVMIFLCLGATAAVMQMIFLRPLVRRFGESRVLAGGLTVFGLGFVVQAAVGWLYVLSGENAAVLTLVPPAVIFATIGQAVCFSTISAMLSKTAEPGRLGSILGFNMSVAAGARIIGPVLAGMLFSSLGPDAPLLFAFAVCLPAAWLALEAGKRIRA